MLSTQTYEEYNELFTKYYVRLLWFAEFINFFLINVRSAVCMSAEFPIEKGSAEVCASVTNKNCATASNYVEWIENKTCAFFIQMTNNDANDTSHPNAELAALVQK